jgi:hypothetical protein
MDDKITIHFAGEDGWGRAVFAGDSGRYYKTVELNPDEGFENLPKEDQLWLLQTLHTCDGKFDGEPSGRVKKGLFVFDGTVLL